MINIRYPIYILSFLVGSIQLINGQCCGDDCGFPQTPQQSADPNEILGTSGYGKENYIAQRDHLTYTIYFENDPEQATAPAQVIDVKDTLDLTKHNPNDFSFGTFTFRDTTIIATPGVTEFSQDVDMCSRGENIIVRIQGTFNKTTGEVRCYMVAYDPVTMDLTENPYLGILYQNTAPPIGEGNFTYRIGLRQDLPDGTVIENQAHITFDLNEPIATNVFVNTLDIGKPTSSISPTYQIEKDTIITLSWSGTDSGSGIAGYSVYVSENDGEFYLWLYNVTETTGEFTGKKDSVYRFYVQATDHVGNQEDLKQQAELTVSLRGNDTKNNVVESDKYGLKIIPNPVSDNAIIEFSLPGSEQIRLSLCNVSGQEIMEIYKGQMEKGINRIPFDAAKLSTGVYIISLQDGNSQIITKFMRK